MHREQNDLLRTDGDTARGILPFNESQGTGLRPGPLGCP